MQEPGGRTSPPARHNMIKRAIQGLPEGLDGRPAPKRTASRLAVHVAGAERH